MTRKRRRLLIATAAMVVLVAASWWRSRPNLDPRFVGTWDVTPPKPLPDDAYPQPIARSILRLSSDGSGSNFTRVEGKDQLDGDHRYWSYDDGRLVQHIEGPANHLPAAFVKWYEDTFNRNMSGERDEFEVISIEPGAIRARYRHIPDRIFTYPRVAD